MPKTYNSLFIETRRALRDAGIEACSLEARLLLSAASGKTREAVLRDMQLYSSDEIEDTLHSLTARRLRGEPAAYVTERWEFYGLELKVTPAVLIPRSDTETLVTRALELVRDRPEDLRFLDLCTGSGCVGCALAHALERSRGVLMDNSLDALDVARENAASLGLARRVECIAGDVRRPPDPALGSFSLIVSNPPYVPRGEIPLLEASVRDFEPHAALDGGEDGLDFYRAILQNSVQALRSGGWLLFEVGEDQAHAVSLLLRRAGLRGVGSARDLQGIERVVFGKK